MNPGAIFLLEVVLVAAVVLAVVWASRRAPAAPRVPAPAPPAVVIGAPVVIAPPPSSGCQIPPDGPGWLPVERVDSVMRAAVRQAMDALGEAPGPTPEASLDSLAAELVRRGFCAERQTDAVMVKRPDGLYEEHHAVAFGTGRWIATSFRGVWRYEA